VFWLNQLRKLLKALNDNTSPNQLAAGFAMGAALGLIPEFNLLELMLWLLIIFLQVNIAMALLGALLFAIVGSLFDPLVERLGFGVLSGIPFLQGLWGRLYNVPLVPFTDFNNTLVMGNLLLGLVLGLPVYYGSRAAIITYRARWRDRFQRSRLGRWMTGLSAFDTFLRWVNR